MVRNDFLDGLGYPERDRTPKSIIRKADARDLPLSDNSIDLIVTSPPYWKKRDYGHADQIGQEDTTEDYVSSLMSAFEEWERVLRDTGTILLNIGDTYKRKSRVGIPWMVARAARDRGWLIRSEIIWSKPNGKPDPTDSRLTNRHEYIFYLTPKTYYFDKFGFKKLYNDPIDVWEISHDRNDGHPAPFPKEIVERSLVMACPPAVCIECGKPQRRGLEKTTELDTSRPQAQRAMEIYKESDLTEEHIRAVQAVGIADAGKGREVQNSTGPNAEEILDKAYQAKEVLGGYFREFTFAKKRTSGWTECECDADTMPGVVLDPFCGSGTTVEVAEELGFSAIGTDIAPPIDLRRFEGRETVQP